MGYFIYISISFYLPFYLYSKFDAVSQKEKTKANNYAQRFLHAHLNAIKNKRVNVKFTQVLVTAAQM